jgi:hypothetical protein
MSILNNTEEDAVKDEAIVVTNADGNLYLGVDRWDSSPTESRGVVQTEYLSSAMFFCAREDAVRAMVKNSIFCKKYGLIYVQTVKPSEFTLSRIF